MACSLAAAVSSAAAAVLPAAETPSASYEIVRQGASFKVRLSAPTDLRTVVAAFCARAFVFCNAQEVPAGIMKEPGELSGLRGEILLKLMEASGVPYVFRGASGGRPAQLLIGPEAARPGLPSPAPTADLPPPEEPPSPEPVLGVGSQEGARPGAKPPKRRRGKQKLEYPFPPTPLQMEPTPTPPPPENPFMRPSPSPSPSPSSSPSVAPRAGGEALHTGMAISPSGR
jgi:hypothetical protein